jgi:hypothetical protein
LKKAEWFEKQPGRRLFRTAERSEELTARIKSEESQRNLYGTSEYTQSEEY